MRKLFDKSNSPSPSLNEALTLEDYKSFFESLGKEVISSATNAKGDIIYVNDKFVEVSQYSRKELLGQNHRIVKSGFHPPEFYKALWNTISSGHVWRGEIKNQAKDGTYYWVDTSIAPVLGADGKPVKYVSVRFLVTEKKQAEEALQQSIEQLAMATAQKQSAQYARSLIEASLDPLVTISPEGKITDVNEGSIEITGIAREELIGTDFSNYFTEPEKAREGYQRVFAKSFVTDYPLTVRHKDGRLTDVLYNASVYKDVTGKVLGVFAAARDVTATKQAAGYARSLIEASLDPLVTISPEGKITDVNEGSIKVTGVPREQLIGTDFSNYFTEPDKAREGYQRVFAKGLVTDYPLTVRHKDGKLTDVLYNASVYKDTTGKVLGVFAAARDVTALKKAEAEVAQRNKELERLADLENFQRLTVGRELKMIELKKEIAELKKKIPPGEISP